MMDSARYSARSIFQSTPSVGRATLGGRKKQIQLSISIHALRGEGDFYLKFKVKNREISIHALRGEGDV